MSIRLLAIAAFIPLLPAFVRATSNPIPGVSEIATA